ncbi:NUDIX hydrolase [Neolewinella litorea]|uniref:NUDIX hydrolase n=1 Tax=Neolewinella litorea TaxID=2562452 RepID=A0A4S4NP12_9BACT|nr:NUDIX domain-containing protein [Neolewinella litorea]THH41756.1 NUDIX hydrolase [Neolewinella litorea]
MQAPTTATYLPHLAYDSVVFGFSGDQLKILIMEYHKTNWFALPGGFVRRDENLNDAARRGLRERTGLDEVYLEQFYTFGDTARFRPGVMEGILAANDISVASDHWLLDRFVTVAYYALIDYNTVVPRPDALSDSINWYALDELPPLLFDHEEIVQRALVTLRENLGKKLVGMNLLPPLFTMKELQRVYEAILGEKLHRSSFQRKMLASGLLERREKRLSGKAHKAPYQYRFLSKANP